MISSLRQRFAPIKRRVSDQIDQGKTILKKQPTLRETEKVNKEAKRLLDRLEANFKTLEELMDDMTEAAAQSEDDIEKKRLENEAEDYATLTLEANETIADLRNYCEENKERLEKNERQSGIEELRSELDKLKTTAKSVNTTYAPKEATVKLPKLNVPSFDGNILKWQEFWDSFHSAIHDNRTLANIDKFNYLKDRKSVV